MKYVSVCAGIEAATVAWHPLGWEPVLFSEIEPFPCAVLKHHYPQVTLVGDFTQLILNPPEADLLVGGTPCQAFSVAGKRLSLEDYRGNLSLAFADLFHAGQYRWAVWENVPGVLSTKDNAFGCLLGRLVGSDAPLLPSRGNKWTNAGVVSGPLATAAWRVLDAQYFGVAQRRRRVFVCVSRGAGNWAAAAALLPVGESVSRHPPARPKAGERATAVAGQGVARSLRGQSNVAHREDVDTIVLPINTQIATRHEALGEGTGFGIGNSGDPAFTLQAGHSHGVFEGGGWPAALAPTLNAAFAEKQGLEDQHINGGAGMFVLDKQGGQVTEGISPTLKTDLSHQMGPVVAVSQVLANDQVVFAIQERAVSENPANGPQGSGVRSDGVAYTLEARHHVQAVAPSVTGGPPFSRTGNERVEAEALVVSLTTEQTPKYAHNLAQTVTKGSPTGGGHPQCVAGSTLRPRRLTPTECARLQGFPDLYLVTDYADADEAHAAQILRQLWREAGTPPTQEQGRGVGGAPALLTPEVLLAGVYGGWLSWEVAARYAAARGALPSANAYSQGVVRGLREAGEARRSPYQRESFGQLAYELGRSVSELPLEEAQITQVLRGSGVWAETQRTWPLRYAPAKKTARALNPDGPRYKALGNSMACPVMHYIGKRIQLVEDAHDRPPPLHPRTNPGRESVASRASETL